MTTAIIPAILLAGRLSAGISLDSDSLAYLHAARHLLQQHALLSLPGPPGTLLTLFPPLYPAAVATALEFVGSLEGAAIVVGIACMVAATALAFSLLRRLDIAEWPAALVTLGVFVHPSVQFVFSFALSEGLYIVIALLVLRVCSRDATHTPSPFAAGIALGLLVGLAFLTRYAGLSLLPVAVVGLMCTASWSARQRVSGVTLAVAISAAIIGAWVARNYLVDGTFLGPRRVSEAALLYPLRRLVTTFGEFVAPAPRLAPFREWIGLTGLLAIVTVLGPAVRWSRFLVVSIAPALSLVVLHVSLMIISQLTTRIDPINARLLSPAVVPAVVAVAGTVRYGLPTWPGQWAKRAAAGMFFVYLALSAYLSAREIGKLPQGLRFGAVSAADVPQPCRDGSWPTFSNRGNYLRFVGAVENARPFPRRRQPSQVSPQAGDEWPGFISTLRSSKACLVWVGYKDLDEPGIGALLGEPNEEVQVKRVSNLTGVYIYEADLKLEDRPNK